MLLLAVVLLMVVAIAIRLLVPVVRRRRMMAELRGDWWSRFESEFHTYASSKWEAAREAERGV